MEMWNVSNFSLVGVGMDTSKPAVIICKSQSFIAFLHSHNITVANIIFNQCDGNIKHILFKDIWQFDQHEQDTIVSLLLFECYFCKVVNCKFFGYGLMGINLVGNSLLNNVTIKLETEKPAFEDNICMYRIMLIYILRNDHHDSDIITMNKISISGYSNNCHSYNLHPVIDIQLQQNQYNMMIIMSDSQFYNMDQTILKFETSCNNNSNTALFKNCTFKNLTYNSAILYELVTAQIPCINTTMAFVDCDFLLNRNVFHMISVAVLENDADGLCTFPTNITVENCNFIGNVGTLLSFGSYNYFNATTCRPHVYMIKRIHIFNTSVKWDREYITDTGIIDCLYMAVHMNGNIIVSENLSQLSIIALQSCNVTFTGNITFTSNICTQVISLQVWWFGYTYINVMEHTKITFTNNLCSSEIISLNQNKKQRNLYPYCLFQYEVTDRNITVLPDRYSISFTNNTIYHNKVVKYREEILESLSHCKWIPTAAFYGFHASIINEQIILINNQQWYHHKKICYCPQNGYSNCSTDLLGPIYPGQVLQLELCIPDAKDSYNVYVETHAKSLPSSACKIANQVELIHSIGNISEIVNFTIVSDSYKECELFLTAQPQNDFYDVFLVELLSCPVGFTFQDGICDCDPLLPSCIEKCYIDHSAIKLPANTWIMAHTQTNMTEYLISDCPMDYCLPNSSNINLLYPDDQCQFNRTGILCSQCQHPLSMVFGSLRCMECTNLHILITIIVIVVGIVLVVLLYLLNLTVTIGTINGIIFYANIISINDSVFLVNDNVFKPLRVFISFVNLDLGIETCFYNGMDSYVKMWLQLFFPLYLIIIAASIIIASRYSSRILRLTYTRSLPVLATLFLLSYTGVLRTVITVLFSYTTITHLPGGLQEVVWSIDANIPLFGVKFTMLFIICAILILLLVAFNITLLFSRILLHVKINCYKSLLISFHTSCKDKYVYWIAVHIITRNVFIAFYVFEIKVRLVLSNSVLVLFTAYQAYTHPYKNKLVNIQELLLLMNLTIMYAASYLNINNILTIVVNITISLAFIQFCAIVFYHFFTYTSAYSSVMVVLKAMKGKVISLFSLCYSYDINEYSYNEYHLQDTKL